MHQEYRLSVITVNYNNGDKTKKKTEKEDGAKDSESSKGSKSSKGKRKR